MKKKGKRFKKCLEAVQKDKPYGLEEAVAILKGMSHPKFDESVEIACKLNIDPKQSEQLVRGTTVLPHGLGKKVSVCVFCKGEDVNKAKEAGADFVGSCELIDKIKGGWLEFDKAASTPEMMKEVAQLGKVLGPRGLMPTPKTGTVGPDIERIVRELKSGKVQFKTDKTGNIHTVAGKVSFPIQNVCANALSLIRAIIASRPTAVKGQFIKKMSISTTMSPALKLDSAKLGT
jgi:large subunit ribosomal protein L1